MGFSWTVRYSSPVLMYEYDQEGTIRYRTSSRYSYSPAIPVWLVPVRDYCTVVSSCVAYSYSYSDTDTLSPRGPSL